MQVGAPSSPGRALAMAAGAASVVWAAEACWLWSPHLVDRAVAALLGVVVVINGVFAAQRWRRVRSFYLSCLVVVLNLLCVGGLVFMTLAFGTYVRGEAVSHPALPGGAR
jgi:hypothetical protein